MSVIIRRYRVGDLDEFLEVARELQSYELELHDDRMPVGDIGSWYVVGLLKRCQAEQGELLVADWVEDYNAERPHSSRAFYISASSRVTMMKIQIQLDHVLIGAQQPIRL